MRTLEADYLIIGAGLAGSTLGFLLRRAGAVAVNVEARDLGMKDKLCAGIVTPGGVSFLSEIFGEDVVARVAALGPLPWMWRSMGREADIRGGYCVVRRKALDDYCLERLFGAGGTVLDRTRLVSVDAGERLAVLRDLGTKEEVTVRYGELVGADGALSSVRKLLTGRRGRSVLSYEGVAPAPFLDAVVTTVDPNEYGYTWYAPRGSDATVGCLYADLEAAQCRRRIEDLCSDLGIAAPKLRGAFIPSGDDVLLQAGEHAWLVGDAAGLADAFGGGGIHNALMSAMRLAESFSDGGRRYEDGMRDQLALLRATARVARSMPYKIWRSVLKYGTVVSRGQRAEGL